MALYKQRPEPRPRSPAETPAFLAAALAGALLAGCASGPEFSKPGASAEDLELDRSICQAEVAHIIPHPLDTDAVAASELQPGPTNPPVQIDRSGAANLTVGPGSIYGPGANSSLGPDFAQYLATRVARVREKHLLLACMAGKGWQAAGL